MIFSFKQCSFVRDFTCWRDLVIRVPLSHNFWGELSRPRPIWDDFFFLDLSQLSHTSRGVSHWDFLSSENFSRFESFESHVTRWDFLSSDNFSLRLFYVPFLVLDYDLFWTYLRWSDCFSKAYKTQATIIQDLFTSILLSKSPFFTGNYSWEPFAFLDTFCLWGYTKTLKDPYNPLTWFPILWRDFRTITSFFCIAERFETTVPLIKLGSCKRPSPCHQPSTTLHPFSFIWAFFLLLLRISFGQRLLHHYSASLNSTVDSNFR